MTPKENPMSIWCSQPEIGRPDFPDDEQRGVVLSYATGWSNHYPVPGDPEQPAQLSTAVIPAWCVPGHEESGDSTPGPWIRLDVDTWAHDWAAGGKTIVGPLNVSVILDEAAAQALVDDLTDWLARPKAHPIEGDPT